MVLEAAVVGRGLRSGCTVHLGQLRLFWDICPQAAMPRARRGGGCSVAGLDGEGVWIGPPPHTPWEIWLRQPAAVWGQQNSHGDGGCSEAD